MGYGAGGILLVVGLVLAYAVDDTVSGVDLHMIGLIAAGVGVLLLVLTALTLNGRRGARSTTTTTHSDGSQSVRESRTDI